MNTHTMESATASGTAHANELFALTDEQILEIAPEAGSAEPSATDPLPPLDTSAANPAPSAQAAPAATTPQPDAPQNAPAALSGPFAGAEDLKALGELYPGGLPQAKTAAERARALDEIDAAYFGAAGNSPEQAGAARSALAQRMLSENPAAFREMVFAGLRALEAAAASGTQLGQHAPVAANHQSPVTSHESLSAYADFERAANADLERSVGNSIERTIAHALPNLVREEGDSTGARRGSVPLRDRLASSVRQDIEAALKSDRQLGEQIAQVLSSRRFDSETRAQVVRLIGDRAQQLVPGAARRVISEWTQSTLAAHRSRTERSAANAASREVPAASADSPASAQASRSQSGPRAAASQGSRDSVARNSAPRSRSLDYRKLSDEQILDL